jgi:hypothetical protein
VATTHADSLDREWLLRAVLVLQAPRAVLGALRDDSDEAAHARQEPVLALMWLSGIAAVLATPVARTLLDDPTRDGLVVAIWAFIGGGLYGAVALWLGGALLHGSSRLLGGRGSYRRARHLFAFASAPVALSLLVVWPPSAATSSGAAGRTREPAAPSSRARRSPSRRGRWRCSRSASTPSTAGLGRARSRRSRSRPRPSRHSSR